MAGTKQYCLLLRFFEEIIIHTQDLFSGSQLYPRNKQNLKRKRPGEQQRHVCWPHQTDATIVLNLEKCVYFTSDTGSGRFGVPTIIVVKKQYYSTTQ